MKEVFALKSRHLIDTFMAESFLHLIKFWRNWSNDFSVVPKHWDEC